MANLSLDSQSPAACARLWQEVEQALGRSEDPLEILIREEEECSVGCSFPQCYVPCAHCSKERT